MHESCCWMCVDLQWESVTHTTKGLSAQGWRLGEPKQAREMRFISAYGRWGRGERRRGFKRTQDGAR